MHEEKLSTKENEARDSNNINPNHETHLTKEDPMKSAANNIKVGNGNEALEMKVEMLDIDSLVKPEHHPRIDQDDDSKALQESIERDGILNPLIVSEASKNKYEITDGTKRCKVGKKMGMKTMPCIIIKSSSPADAAHRSFTINNERNSLNIIEIATHLKKMTDKFGYSLRDLEIKGYGSPASIANKLKLLELDESVQKQIQAGELTVAHGLELVKISNSGEQQRMAERVIDKNWTAQTTTTHINRYMAKSKKQDALPETQQTSFKMPGDTSKTPFSMSSIVDDSIHMIISAPEHDIGGNNINVVKENLKEYSRILVPGGVIVLCLQETMSIFDLTGDYAKSKFYSKVYKYQNILLKHNMYLTDRIILPYCRSNPIGNANKEHTSYRVFNNYWPFYICRKEGTRPVLSKEIVAKSKLSKEDLDNWTFGVWEPISENQMNSRSFDMKEIIGRFIKMFSYEVDTVFVPSRPLHFVPKVVKELNRIGIDSGGKIHCKSNIKTNLGIKTEEEGIKESETMTQFYEQTIASETETFEPSIETISAGPEETDQNIEFAEEHFEASMPL